MEYVQEAYTAAGLGYFGLLAVPFVVPTAFAGGVVAWRLVPERTPYRGPVVGLLATVLTCAFAVPLVAGAMVAGFGFYLTWWPTLPLGVVSGWIHERALAYRAEGAVSPNSRRPRVRPF